MSKSLINLPVQISKVCQKSEFQIKFKKDLFLELSPAPVFGPAAWALDFGQLALPLPTRPRPLGRPNLPSRPRWPQVGGTLPACRFLRGEIPHLTSRRLRPSPRPTESRALLGRLPHRADHHCHHRTCTRAASQRRFLSHNGRSTPPLITPHHHPG
jgi:hypothetical protein